MVRAAHSFGLEATGLRVEVDDLRTLRLPAILHWNFNHFVVLERIRGVRAVVLDPAFGRRQFSLQELSDHFTGVVIIFEPLSTFRRRQKEPLGLVRYWAIARDHAAAILQVLIASLAIQLLGLFIPLSTQLLIDHVVIERQQAWFLGLLAVLCCTSVARVALAFVRSYILQGLQQILDATLMKHFVKHLLHLPLEYYLQRESGELVQRLQSNRSVRDLLSSESVSLVLDGVTLFGYLFLMLLYNSDLAHLVIALALARMLVLLAFRLKVQEAVVTELFAGGRESAALVEALTGFETTIASGAESLLLRRWNNRAVPRFNAAIRRRRLLMTSRHIMTLLQGLTTAAVLWIGGKKVIGQELTIGSLGAFLSLQYLFLGPLDSALQSAERLQQLRGHLGRLNDVLCTVQERMSGEDPGTLTGDIELRHVSLSYAPHLPPVVSDVSIRIKPGMRVALVGRSGAGKSTLARLLIGLHEATSGEILFEGRSCNDLNLQLLRKQIGVVLQDTFLFDDSIRANIKFGAGQVSMPQVHRAARLACLDKKVATLPGAFEFRIGEGGAFLSGGERQRLSLARALVRSPAILLLDEATSALNVELEEEILRNLQTVGCTTIFVSHRFTHLATADLIVVMERGRVVQTGSYADLTASEGPFRALISAADQNVKGIAAC